MEGKKKEEGVRNMAELQLMLEALRSSQESFRSTDNFETPYLSYDELYPNQQGISLSLIKQSEKKFWKELVDSNIRAGTIACLWCLKAQAIKRLSGAFNKWKVFTALKNQELMHAQLHELQKSAVVSGVIDNALSIIKRYREGGIMNQVNGTNNWKSDPVSSSLNFPWEERRNPQSQFDPLSHNLLSLSMADPLVGTQGSELQPSASGVTPSLEKQDTFTRSNDLSQSHGSIAEQMKMTETEWNFARGQYRETGTASAEHEREALLAISYELIKRGESDKRIDLSQVPSTPALSPRDAPPATDNLVSKKSSLNLLNPEEFSPTKSVLSSPTLGRDKPSQATSHTYSPEHEGKPSNSTLASEFDYKINEPSDIYRNNLQQLSPINKSTRDSLEGTANKFSRFPDNTLQVSNSDPLYTSGYGYDDTRLYSQILNSSYDQKQTTRNHIQQQPQTRGSRPQEARGRTSTITPVRSKENKKPSGSGSKSTSKPSPSRNNRKPYSEKTLVDVIKFRHNKEGNYVKDLLTPREQKTPNDSNRYPDDFHDDNNDLLRLSANSNHSVSSFALKSGTKPRSISPGDRPRYLMPTNARLKKMVSAEEAQMIKEKQMQRSKRVVDPPNGKTSHNHQQQYQYLDSSGYSQLIHSQEFPNEFNHNTSSNHHTGLFPSENYASLAPPSSSSYPPVHHSSSAVPPPPRSVTENVTDSAGNNHPLPEQKDPEYEYYEKLLQEQQQQFLHYQAQTEQRGAIGTGDTNSRAMDPQMEAATSVPQQEYLSYKQYTATMGNPPYGGHPVENTLPMGSNGAKMDIYNNISIPPSAPPTDHSISYGGNPAVYSLHPEYYHSLNESRVFHPEYAGNSFLDGSHNLRTSQGSKKKASPQKMDKAQRMLLYGVLHDVMDAKRAWQRNLRR